MNAVCSNRFSRWYSRSTLSLGVRRIDAPPAAVGWDRRFEFRSGRGGPTQGERGSCGRSQPAEPRPVTRSPALHLTPRTAKAAPWGRLAGAPGSPRRGRAAAGRDGAATSRADRGAPPRGAQPHLGSARPPACENNAGQRLCAVDARPPFGHVQIDFHDPPLAPCKLDQRREPASNPLRNQSRPGHRKTFFAVCIEIVLAPSRRP